MNVDFLFPQERVFSGDEAALAKVVTPGEHVTSDTAFMRGHGTYADGERVMASVAGTVERVNKLLSVKPVRSRYVGEVGDVVVGRVTEVQQKRWKVDINHRCDAVLLLSSINLPGGVQRRKSESDELQMRTFFVEGDLVVAEIQGFFGDSSASLQTRSLKYGKLRNGTFVTVPPALVRRCKSHFHRLSIGVDVILGLNGYIWVSKHTEPVETLDPGAIYSNQNEYIEPSLRSTIARVCNCIQALSRQSMIITDSAIMDTYEASLAYPNVQDLLRLEVVQEIGLKVQANTAGMDLSAL